MQRSGRPMKPAVLRCCCLLAVLLVVISAPATLFAQTGAPAASSSSPSVDSSKALNDKLAQLDQRVTAAQSSADNSWMMVSAALVLMMTGPGLALFYGGLVRRKNMLAIMMQSFMLMAGVSNTRCCGGSGPSRIPITQEPFRNRRS